MKKSCLAVASMLLFMMLRPVAASAAEGELPRPIAFVSNFLQLSEAQTASLVGMIQSREAAIRPIAEALQAKQQALRQESRCEFRPRLRRALRPDECHQARRLPRSQSHSRSDCRDEGFSGRLRRHLHGPRPRPDQAGSNDQDRRRHDAFRGVDTAVNCAFGALSALARVVCARARCLRYRALLVCTGAF